MSLNFILSVALLPIIAAQAPPSVANCSEGAAPCGSAFFSTCCPAQWNCNYRRGIPICQDPDTRVIHGFSDELRIVLKPMPTDQRVVTLLESQASAAVTIPAPAETDTSSPISFTPTDAWSTISLDDSDQRTTCGGALSPHQRVTNVLNATISFNYTGPAIVVRTIPSKTGGIFSVLIDGFNTTSYVDTYLHNASTPDEARSESLNPGCYRVHQFPPMNIVPPGYESRETHTISLVYVGAGPLFLAAGADPSSLSVHFDSFALPLYSEAQMSQDSVEEAYQAAQA
ncbi:hypothetical protein MD484_g2280, partial [Candolleomyces efflorescens]